jgi:death-on-curing protein
MIDEFGGDPTTRDEALLESAVMMPTAKFGGKLLHPDLPAMAAAYLFHICRNHPFTDGNKRTALATAILFVQLNGSELVASDDELGALTIGIANGSTIKETVTLFFRAHVHPTQET